MRVPAPVRNRLAAQRSNPSESPTYVVTAATRLGLTSSIHKNRHSV